MRHSGNALNGSDNTYWRIIVRRPLYHFSIFCGQIEQKALYHPNSLPIFALMNMTYQFHAKKILVVDDNPVILKALSLALSARGYDVFTAVDASEAFGFARLEKLDLILLDIYFPPDVAQTGMTWDAFRIIEWMQRTGAAEGVPIIVISGAEAEEVEARCLDAGVMAFFQKPIQMRELLLMIHRVFNPGVEGKEPQLAMLLPPQIINSAFPSPNYLSR